MKEIIIIAFVLDCAFAYQWYLVISCYSYSVKFVYF